VYRPLVDASLTISVCLSSRTFCIVRVGLVGDFMGPDSCVPALFSLTLCHSVCSGKLRTMDGFLKGGRTFPAASLWLPGLIPLLGLGFPLEWFPNCYLVPGKVWSRNPFKNQKFPRVGTDVFPLGGNFPLPFPGARIGVRPRERFFWGTRRPGLQTLWFGPLRIPGDTHEFRGWN